MGSKGRTIMTRESASRSGIQRAWRHLAGLSAEGAISETTNLDARQIFPAGDLMTGVVLDDNFAVQTLPTQCASAADLVPDLPLQDGGMPVSTAATSCNRAEQWYAREKLAGSPDKQVKAQSRATIVGGELDS